MRYLWIILLLFPSVSQASDIVDRLQNISVTITSGTSSGSGVLFTREDKDSVRTFVWTAAHVVDDLRKTREIFIRGDRKTVVEFSDASVINEFRQDGRRIGEMTLDARVVRYSNADDGEDLALLEIRKHGFVPLETSVEFYDGEIPKIGTELYHVGSLLGQVGANSLTTGVVSQIGRVLDLGASGTIFDQSTCTAFPGSSGGGVFLKSDGRCVGLLVRGSGEGFNLIVPVRRIREWAKAADVLWAMDRSIDLPPDEELKKRPVEDASTGGVELSSGVERQMPFLIQDRNK